MDSLRAFGHDVVVELTADLVRVGAPSLHFYTMNQATPIIVICKDAGVHPHTPQA
jgi:methylenetetrahydrofolate reductase (NADPH)